MEALGSDCLLEPLPFPCWCNSNLVHTMPLVEPITMSSSLVKGATSSKAATVASPSSTPLHPVQTKQTPLAQTARHALPALLTGLFLLRFPALVTDPVSTMATSLPLVAALQISYGIVCLPAAGSQGAKPARKPRPGEKKRTGAEGPGPNTISVRNLPIS